MRSAFFDQLSNKALRQQMLFGVTTQLADSVQQTSRANQIWQRVRAFDCSDCAGHVFRVDSQLAMSREFKQHLQIGISVITESLPQLVAK